MRNTKIRRRKAVPKGGFASTFEHETAKQLKRFTSKTKTLVSYEGITLPYTLHKKYVPDFVIVKGDGSVMFIECKGYLDMESRVKMVAVKASHPSADIRFVFAKDNKISSKSNFRYSEWATKYGFPCSIGNVPKSWLD